MKGRPCSVCQHPKRRAIEQRLQQGVGGREIARRVGLTHWAIMRHATHGTTKEPSQQRCGHCERSTYTVETCTWCDGLVCGDCWELGEIIPTPCGQWPGWEEERQRSVGTGAEVVRNVGQAEPQAVSGFKGSKRK